jgi:hypothetical protein
MYRSTFWEQTITQNKKRKKFVWQATSNKSAMKEAVKHKIPLACQNCLLRRANVDIRRMAFRVCRERMLN